MSNNNQLKQSNGSPFKGYVFSHNRRYDPKEVAQLATEIDAAEWASQQIETIKSGVEVMITDKDDYAIFHAMNSKIIFPVEAAQLQGNMTNDAIKQKIEDWYTAHADGQLSPDAFYRLISAVRNLVADEVETSAQLAEEQAEKNYRAVCHSQAPMILMARADAGYQIAFAIRAQRRRFSGQRAQSASSRSTG